MLDFILVSNMEFFLCDTVGFLRAIYIIKVILNFLRFVVPIIIIIMITKDLFKNVINPKEKDGMKKIINRLVAGVVVFLVPTLVSLVVYVIDLMFDNGDDTNYRISSCYINANKNCIDTIEEYLNCSDVTSEENKKCQEFRRCNNYRITSIGESCSVETLLDDKNCLNLNENNEYIRYFKN